MRLPQLEPRQIPAPQKPLYDDMNAGISSYFNNFIAKTEDGALIGPWGVWIHQPVIGAITWQLVKAVTVPGKVPERIRQIVILCVGSRYDAAYELYAHTSMAKAIGVSGTTLETLACGSRPTELNEQEGCAYDFTSALLRPGVLPSPVYEHAVEVFGQEGIIELINLVGVYSLVSVTLNGFNVAVPVTSEA
jgi:4-carboxymuconolactone decarboxylase